MELVDQIEAVNGAIQGHMRSQGGKALKADDAAEIVYAKGILAPDQGPPGAPGFTFRKFLRDIRDVYGYEGLYKLVGAKQANNSPHGQYTMLRFEPPGRETIVELLESKPPQGESLQNEKKGDSVLPDHLADELDVVFVGASVGEESARRQHYYSNPTNRFWDLVNQSELVSDIVGSENDHLILEDKCGLTDLAKKRGTSSDAGPARSDFDVDGLLQRIQQFNPKVVAFNGKRAFGEVFGHDPTAYGVSARDIGDSFVFVLPSSSGSDASMSFEEKLDWYKRLKAFVRSL